MSRRSAFWGKEGAGILFVSHGRVLLALRSLEVNESHTWGVPGGKVDPGERPYEAALREVREELGSVPPHVVVDEGVFINGSFRYTTFVALVQPEVVKTWKPRLNWEHDEVEWFDAHDLPQDDLHFGLAALLRSRPDILYAWATRT